MMRRGFMAAFFAIAVNSVGYAQATTPIPAPAPTPQTAPAPKVMLTTTMGVIEITLDPVGAPKTSAHMLRLFQSGHYNGAAVFRIEPGFLIQLGDLDANFKHRWMREDLRKPVPLETATNKHFKGSVSLARADDPNSGLSTFYFDLGDNPSLNADPNALPNTTGYATFGKVTAGWEVVEAIAAVERAPTGGPFPGKAPKVPITIVSVVTDPPAPKPKLAAPTPVVKGKAKVKRR